MNTVQASVGLDATALKLLGVVTMTVDHIGCFLGTITPLLVWLGKGNREKILGLTVGLCLIALEMGGIQMFSLAAVPVLALYNGKRGKYQWKPFFYLYYAIHLAVLYGIAQLM